MQEIKEHETIFLMEGVSKIQQKKNNNLKKTTH